MMKRLLAVSSHKNKPLPAGNAGCPVIGGRKSTSPKYVPMVGCVRPGKPSGVKLEKAPWKVTLPLMFTYITV